MLIIQTVLIEILITSATVTGQLADAPFISGIWCLSSDNPYLLQQQICPYVLFYNLF